MNPRQLCNLVYALTLEGQDKDERAEYLAELYAPLDPMEQYEEMMWRMQHAPPA